MNKSKKYMYIGVFILLVSLIGSMGTYAWFTWSSTNNTSVTLAIGKLADVTFTTGPDIKVDNLSPVYNYTDGASTTFTIENRDTKDTLIYTVKLNIINIDYELQDKTFKYTLLENNKVVKEGTFEKAQSDSSLTLNTSVLTKATSYRNVTSNYKLYFWIDGNEENNPNMMNKSLTGKIDVSIESNVLMEGSYHTSTSTFLGSDIKRANISSVSFINNLNIPEGLTTIDVSKDKNGSILMWYTDEDEDGNYDITIGSEGKIYASSGYYLFAYLTNATSLDLTNFNTSNVTNMYYMFAGCSSLTTLDLSNFNTSNVTNMSNMFVCPSLTTLNLSSFDTSNVTNMEDMFSGCRSLVALDVSNFDTSKVTNMRGMFQNCKSLTTLDVSNLNTSNVTKMNSMFFRCSSLTTLDLSNFNTSNVKNMSSMFDQCSSLATLDLSSFNTSNATDISYMFNYCSKLTSIDLRKADLSNATSYSAMFQGVSTKVTIYLKDTEANRTFMSSKFSYYSPTYIS